jgi:PAS domain-containing protein
MSNPQKSAPGPRPKPKSIQPLASTAGMIQSLVDNVRDYAIILLDPQGNVLTWNAGAERLKGWKPGGDNRRAFFPVLSA